MKHGKKYQDSAKLIESSKLYDTAEAIDLCVKSAKAKFDETVEVHVRLAFTPAMPTSRSAARSFCPTER
jgi:ribosomal protein L1